VQLNKGTVGVQRDGVGLKIVVHFRSLARIEEDDSDLYVQRFLARARAESSQALHDSRSLWSTDAWQ
jgi:hypothetical protein